MISQWSMSYISQQAPPSEMKAFLFEVKNTTFSLVLKCRHSAHVSGGRWVTWSGNSVSHFFPFWLLGQRNDFLLWRCRMSAIVKASHLRGGCCVPAPLSTCQLEAFVSAQRLSAPCRERHNEPAAAHTCTMVSWWSTIVCLSQRFHDAVSLPRHNINTQCESWWRQFGRTRPNFISRCKNTWVVKLTSQT